MGCKLCFVHGSENFVGNFIHLNGSICLHTLRFTFKFEVIHLFEIYEFGTVKNSRTRLLSSVRISESDYEVKRVSNVSFCLKCFNG